MSFKITFIVEGIPVENPVCESECTADTCFIWQMIDQILYWIQNEYSPLSFQMPPVQLVE